MLPYKSIRTPKRTRKTRTNDTQLVEFDDFVKYMSIQHCVFSEATIRGMLIDAEVTIPSN